MERPFQQEIGRRMRRRRMALGLMQNDLAERAQIPQAHVSRFERGDFDTMNPERLAMLARALRTTTDYLLGLSDEAGPTEDEDNELEPAVVA